MGTRRSIVGACLLVLVFGAVTESALITLSDGSAFSVELVGHVGNTWTYEVKELQGKDLSHWVLGIPCLLDPVDHVIAWDPAEGFEKGYDGSTGFAGLKWNTEEGFSAGLFSFILDGDYPESDIEALVKAGPNYNTGIVRGPVCDDPPPPVPVPGAVVLGGIGMLFGGGLLRRQRAL